MSDSDCFLPPIPVALPRRRPVRGALLASRPVAGQTQYFAATTSAPRWARRHTADLLERWGVRDLVWPACQVVSELITDVIRSAWRHQQPASPACRLTLKLHPTMLTVEVWDPLADGGSGSQILRDTARGLAIVEALSAGPLVVFAPGGPGRTVVATLARP